MSMSVGLNAPASISAGSRNPTAHPKMSVRRSRNESSSSSSSILQQSAEFLMVTESVAGRRSLRRQSSEPCGPRAATLDPERPSGQFVSLASPRVQCDGVVVVGVGASFKGAFAALSVPTFWGDAAGAEAEPLAGVLALAAGSAAPFFDHTTRPKREAL